MKEFIKILLFCGVLFHAATVQAQTRVVIVPLGGSEGDAVPSDVLEGKTFSNDAGPATGSMPNVGQQNITPVLNAQGISAGYHDGSGSVAGDADLVPGNIRSGTTIFNVTGSSIGASG
ncbi:MAG: hypothetical protein ACYCYR_12300, partial [Desulfobulbaceae bacterium]